MRILIVGPASDDLAELGDEFAVGYLRADPNGLSSAINAGWKVLWADCEFLTWLGDDDLLAPGSFFHSQKALEATPTAAFVYGRTRYINAASESIYLASPTNIAPWYMKYGQDYVAQPGSLVRRSAIMWDPPLDANLKNSMDLDLFLRLAAPGRHRWVYLRREVSAYRLHPGAITSNKGIADEGDIVRDAYGRSRRHRVLRRFALRYLERVFVWFQWHTPSPAVPLLGDESYLIAASGASR